LIRTEKFDIMDIVFIVKRVKVELSSFSDLWTSEYEKKEEPNGRTEK